MNMKDGLSFTYGSTTFCFVESTSIRRTYKNTDLK